MAVPRRTPDRRVEHRPRDHRDAGRTGPQRLGGFRAARLGGEVLLVGGAAGVPIKIPPEGMVMCGAYA